MIWWLVVAVLGGAFAALQSSVNGVLSRKIGMAATVSLSTVVFTVICAFYLTWDAYQEKVPWNKLRDVQPAEYLSGVFGFLLVLCMATAFPRLGALYSIVLMILGQCLTALVIDQFGLLGMPVQAVSLTRVAAIGLILGGVFLLNR